MKMRNVIRAAAAAAILAGAAAPASAQQRPLVTEDPETIGAGIILLEGGLDFGRGQLFPVSGLEGHLVRFPVLGISIGISSIAEVQIDGSPYTRLTITDRHEGPLADLVTAEGDRTTSPDDIIVATKVRVLSETAARPAVGLRFATKLPNASNESGLGLDTTDFHFSALAGKTVQSIRVVADVGLGILGDPTRGDRQNDVLLYGLSLARAIAQGLEVVGEINGRYNTDDPPPPGTDSRGVMRLGARYTRGPARADLGLLLGLTSRDPSVGLTVGLTYVFKGFSVP